MSTQSHHDDDMATTDLLRLVAAAADLCRKPFRHAVRLAADHRDGRLAADVSLLLEVRDQDGTRLPQQDLELDIFPSGQAGPTRCHLTLAWLHDPEQPMMWHGQHPIWMDAQGCRCPCPRDGEPLEALARRLRALLSMEE